MSTRTLHQKVRPSPIFLALVGLTAVGGVLAWTAGRTTPTSAYIGVFLFVIAGWLVSLCLHEFGHAYTAWRFGDQDVAMRGYLTLNPLKYSFANLVLGVLLLVATRLFWDPNHPVFWAGVAFLGFLQLTALVLNLLPIPGLDGFGALEPHLSPATRRSLEPVRQFGFIILIVILMTPALNRWFFKIVFWFFDLSGVPADLAMFGGHLTRFWSAWL